MEEVLKKCLTILLVMVFSLAGMRSSVFALMDEGDTLKGLKGVHVRLEDLDQDIKQSGLHMKYIQTDVELKLRLAGIKVLTDEEYLKEKGMPYLYINVTTYTNKSLNNLFVYSVTFDFIQGVFLARNPNLSTYGITWNTGYVGIGDTEKIRDIIKDHTDMFINAYLSVNPKK